MCQTCNAPPSLSGAAPATSARRASGCARQRTGDPKRLVVTGRPVFVQFPRLDRAEGSRKHDHRPIDAQHQPVRLHGVFARRDARSDGTQHHVRRHDRVSRQPEHRHAGHAGDARRVDRPPRARASDGTATCRGDFLAVRRGIPRCGGTACFRHATESRVTLVGACPDGRRSPRTRLDRPSFCAKPGADPAICGPHGQRRLASGGGRGARPALRQRPACPCPRDRVRKPQLIDALHCRRHAGSATIRRDDAVGSPDGVRCAARVSRQEQVAHAAGRDAVVGARAAAGQAADAISGQGSRRARASTAGGAVGDEPVAERDRVRRPQRRRVRGRAGRAAEGRRAHRLAHRRHALQGRPGGAVGAHRRRSRRVTGPFASERRHRPADGDRPGAPRRELAEGELLRAVARGGRIDGGRVREGGARGLRRRVQGAARRGAVGPEAVGPRSESR